eukprot:4926427-Amphidinium_carterae.1
METEIPGMRICSDLFLFVTLLLLFWGPFGAGGIPGFAFPEVQIRVGQQFPMVTEQLVCCRRVPQSCCESAMPCLSGSDSPVFTQVFMEEKHSLQKGSVAMNL